MGQYRIAMTTSPKRRADAFQSLADRGILWINAQWKPLLVLVIAIGLGATAVAWWRGRAAQTESAASALLYQATQQATPSSENSAALLAQVSTQYPGTVAAIMAQLALTRSLLDQGNTAEAIRLLQPLADAKRHHEYFHLMAVEALAYAYESAQQYTEAAATFRRLTAVDEYVDMAGAHRGVVRCLIAAGDRDAAQRYIEQWAAEQSTDTDVASPSNLGEMESLWITYRAAISR